MWNEFRNVIPSATSSTYRDDNSVYSASVNSQSVLNSNTDELNTADVGSSEEVLSEQPSNSNETSLPHISDVDSLAADIASMHLDQNSSDLNIVFNNRTFPVHRAILGARSEYFRALLYNGLKESRQNDIELQSTSSSETFELIVKYMYTGVVNLENSKLPDLLEMFALVNQFCFTQLQVHLAKYLTKILTIENVCPIFDSAQVFHCEDSNSESHSQVSLNKDTSLGFDLLCACYGFMNRKASEIVSLESFTLLSSDALINILGRDSFCAPEIEIFIAVCKWIRINAFIDNVPNSDREYDTEVTYNTLHIQTNEKEGTFSTSDHHVKVIKCLTSTHKAVLSTVRLHLISTNDLLKIVRPTNYVSADSLLDAIQTRAEKRYHSGGLICINSGKVLRYRGFLFPNENVAQQISKFGFAQVLTGELKEYLLDGNSANFDSDRGFTRHSIHSSAASKSEFTHDPRPGSISSSVSASLVSVHELGHGIVIKLGMPCILNHFKMLLWDKDQRSYSYYIEVSMSLKGSVSSNNDESTFPSTSDWIRVVDHTSYHCRSWQFLHFEPQVMRYIRIVGTKNTVNNSFHLVSFEAKFLTSEENTISTGVTNATKPPVTLTYDQQLTGYQSGQYIVPPNAQPTLNTSVVQAGGIIVPTSNVALITKSAFVVEGVCRIKNALLNGDINNYDRDSGYTCHQLGSGCIMVQLGQPYVLSSMRLLLWDCDDRYYSYYIAVSVNKLDWEIVCDRSREICQSWQLIRFPQRVVVYIRIVGTRNTANDVFHVVHFECPGDESSVNETDSVQDDQNRKCATIQNSTDATSTAAETQVSNIQVSDAPSIVEEDLVEETIEISSNQPETDGEEHSTESNAVSNVSEVGNGDVADSTITSQDSLQSTTTVPVGQLSVVSEDDGDCTTGGRRDEVSPSDPNMNSSVCSSSQQDVSSVLMLERGVGGVGSLVDRNEISESDDDAASMWSVGGNASSVHD